MASQAQINANRENASRSTGPATEAGKARSSRNAARHGALAAVIPADTPGFQEMLVGLYEGLCPANEAERILVDQIALTMVRLQRCMEAEQRTVEAAEAAASGAVGARPAIAAYLQSDISPLILRYEASLNRLIQRNLHLLRDMKADFDWMVARTETCRYIYREPVEEPSAAPDPPAGPPVAHLSAGPADHIAVELASFRKNTDLTKDQRRSTPE